MKPILESDFAEFVWLPFVVGAIILLAMRVVVFGRIRDLVDLFVLYTYFGLFSAWAFYQKLYDYGHTLSPDAAIEVEGFTPPIFGEAKIANFYVASFPAGGSYALAAIGAIFALALLIAFWQGRGQWRQSRAVGGGPDGGAA
jgi:hypothetical protein